MTLKDLKELERLNAERELAQARVGPNPESFETAEMQALFFADSRFDGLLRDHAKDLIALARKALEAGP